TRTLARGMCADLWVNGLSGRPEPVAQRRRIEVERAEDEAAIGVDARHLRDVEFRILEVAGVAVGPRHAPQFSGVEEIPAVIRALERLRVALVPAAQRGAAVGA